MLDPVDFEIVTFDCYGTLIDWETGILEALRPVVEAHGVDASDDALLELYGETEAEAEHGPFRPYREILRAVARRIGERLDFETSADEERSLEESIGAWPAFDDTRDGLRRLQAKLKVGILSNVDDDLFAATQPNLGIEPDLLVTALQVRSYKPAHGHFEEALRRLRIPRGRMLHAAQSLFHDVAPARALGLTTVWVDRRSRKDGSGATPSSGATPDHRVDSLAGLCELLGV